MRFYVTAVLTAVLFAAPALAADPSLLKDQKDKVSYSIGLDIGSKLKEQSIDVNPDALSAGIKDSLSGEKPLLTDDEMKAVLTQFQQEMRAKAEEKLKVVAEKNKKEGEEFLVANKAKEGVVTLPSGLQYKVLKEGSGESPKASDTVTTHYKGTLIDGTEFDNSYKRGEPVSFPVTGVIKGWSEALQLMKPGAKWQLFVPSNLAYGERGAGQVIGPNATLIFEVELISIK
jgi:FKBP-type peptidyl-prolyl cis-trans isomerase FklB